MTTDPQAPPLPHEHRVLVIEDRVPVKELGCGYPRSLRILEELADAGCRVTLFPLQFPERAEPYSSLLRQKGIEVIEPADWGKLDFARFYLERRHQYDVVFISRPHNMKEVLPVLQKEKPAKQRIIYDAEALFSLREILRRELLGEPIPEMAKQQMIREEIRLIGAADVVTAVSRREREILKSYQVPRVEVLSHHIAPAETAASFEERRDLLFVGGFTPASPNEDAILSFVRDVFPTVREKLDVRLWIVGTNFLDSVKKLASENIVVTGQVTDLETYYNRCRLFVAPTRYAAGIPLKLLECLAHGLPAVVTPLIAEQLGLERDVVLIGEDPQDFARKILLGYTDKKLWTGLRSNGLAHIRTQYNRERFMRSIRDTILAERGGDES